MTKKRVLNELHQIFLTFFGFLSVKLPGLFSEVSEYVASRGLDITVKGLGIPDRFITQAPVTRQRELCGLDTERIYSEIAGLFQK